MIETAIVNKLNIIKQSVEQALQIVDLQFFQELRNALEGNEFYIYYEPVVNIKNEDYEVVGIEALIRWKHPSNKIIRPIDFIPKAEANDELITKIGKWVLESACHHTRRLNIIGYPINVSVNLSPRQITEELPTQIRKVIKSTGLRPDKLNLEITENLPILSVNESIKIFQKIADLGVKLTLDDFGIGYSSMEYVRSFPVNTVKIDKSFLTGGVKNSAIVKAMINLCNDLRIDAIAEGVETPEQIAFLKEIGCHLAQGFLFCEPGAYYNAKI